MGKKLFLSRWVGFVGERLAAIYLKTRQFEILAANHRIPRGEIDLLCKKRNTLYVVEVRSHWSASQKPPEQLFPQSKIRKVLRNGATVRSGLSANSGLEVGVILVRVWFPKPLGCPQFMTWNLTHSSIESGRFTPFSEASSHSIVRL